MQTLTVADGQTDWLKEVTDFGRAGFHTSRGINRAVLAAATSTWTPFETVDDSISIVPVRDYLSRCKAVGATLMDGSAQDQATTQIRHGSILVVRGSPQLWFLRYLGETLRLPATLLLGDLDIPESFKIRPLSSQRSRWVTVHMISLGQYPAGEQGRHAKGFKAQQSLIYDRTARHKPTLLERAIPGVEKCRKINLHARGHFSVEQNVTLIVYDVAANSWSGIVFNDSGQPSENSPWRMLGAARHSQPLRPRFFPMTRAGSCAFGPSTGFRGHDETEEFLNPFAFLSDLLETSALSWTRFLSFLEGTLEYRDSDTEERVDILRNDKSVLDRAGIYFGDVLDLIDQYELLGWSRCRRTDGQEAVNAIASRLRGDFAQLRIRAAAALSELHMQSIQVEMSTVSILESKKGLEQAEKMRLLTFLAYTFIPLTFVSSLFGMNVTAFTQPNPPISTFLTVALPFSALCLSVPLYKQLGDVALVAFRALIEWGRAL